MEKKYYTYIITNTINDKVYIGMTSNPEKRFKEHSKSSSLIGKFIKKNGIENFKIDILHEGTKNYCLKMEIIEIKKHDSISNGFNVSRGDFHVLNDKDRNELLLHYFLKDPVIRMFSDGYDIYDIASKNIISEDIVYKRIDKAKREGFSFSLLDQ